ncbi:MAG: choice-of-anchor D domain-containing protein [Deltaproteobacteria bacterium]|nr:choice-of-anchor D domain-containing protein [Deltaproteobacteria bacterium]
MKLSIPALALALAACTVPTAELAPVDGAVDGATLDAAAADAALDAGPDAAPDAMLDPAMLTATPAGGASFGNVVVQATSSESSYTVTNDGDLASGALALTVDDPALGFAVTSDTCGGQPLAGHASCTFAITFTPPTAGPVATTLHIAGTPGGELTRALAGTGLTRGAVDIVEASYDFGDVGIDAGALRHTFDVTNTGQVTITAPVPTIGGGDGFFVDGTTCTQMLAPAAHCAVTIRFDPASVGAKPGSLTITSGTGGSDAAVLGGTGIAHVHVASTGTGVGVIQSNQPGLDCGSDCDEDFASSPVTLRATPALGSTFAGWTGDCIGLGSCTLDLTGGKAVGAVFTAITQALGVTRAGTGAGAIASTPAGIACPGACAAPFPYGATVTLVATPTAGSTFAGWSGDCVADPCVVTMDQARDVTATFDAITPTLTVALAGSGTGAIAGPGIDCGGDCSEIYAYNTSVTLTATAAAGNTFVGWSGACNGVGACTIAMSQARSVTATFDKLTPTLTVAISGGATGAVTSDPAGIACPGDCSEAYDYATIVTLTPSAAPGVVFTGWSGACTGSGACMIPMTFARNVVATFEPFHPLLTVSKPGSGTGTVTGPGIACGTDCTEATTYGASITLAAAAAPDSTFTGWSGACTGTGTCTITMDQTQTAIATFDRLTPELAVALAGSGAGTVASSPAGIDCGTHCTQSFAFGTSVMLTASATNGSTFAGWSGACTGTSASCTVLIDRARAVTATFDAVTPPLTVAITGSGRVTASAGGIDCPGTCAAAMAYGATVTLSAAANVGSTFAGWSGACTGSGACTVTMTQARDVGATFTVDSYPVTVTTVGNGAVALAPGGTACGSGCRSFPYGTVVTLTATADVGATFAGWSGTGAGTCAGKTTACTIVVDQARAITATFTINQYDLTLSVPGGGGTLSPSPAGAACGAGCARFAYNTAVTLTASPAPGRSFGTWGGSGAGACAGSTGPICTVTMDQARAVSATFTVNSYDLTLVKTGSGSGGVATNPGGASCGAGCSTYPYGTMVTLTATASPGSTFAGWSGSGAGSCAGTSTATCAVVIDQARTVIATFTLDSEPLTLTTVGQGAIAPSVGGTACGAGCSSYPYGTALTLTATAAPGWTFTGWSGTGAGTCAGTTTACAVTMDQARAITATFTINQYPLTISITGSGTVGQSAGAAGTACGAGCTQYPYQTAVTLTANPGVGASFAGWGGACSGSAACTVTMDQARTVTATFTVVQVALTTTVTGSGVITQSAGAAGAPCGTNCTSYPFGTQVTLGTTATVGWTFTGWGGACAGSGACAVTMDQARTVTATFTLNTYPLTVTIGSSSGGSGTVAPSPAGTSCGTSCWTYSHGQQVSLTPTAAVGSAFVGWGGACTGAGACTVTMDQVRTVTATFLGPQVLTVQKLGNGAGTVASSPAGISCGASCSASFGANSTVNLTASPSATTLFTGWGGACSGASTTCTVTMDQARSVTATFTAARITMSIAGTGSGAVASNPTGLSCTTSCTADFTAGQTVVLTATAAPGSTFAGWTGACTGTGACTLVMDQPRAVTASFTLNSYTLTLAKAGDGTGTIATTNLPGNISCGAACTVSVPYGTVVNLAQSAGAGAQFTSWDSGCGSNVGCMVTITGPTTVTATFVRSTYDLTIDRAAVAVKWISGTGINCGVGSTHADCAETYPRDTVVTLTAGVTVFNGCATHADIWTGCEQDPNNPSTCTVTMTADTAVSLTYTSECP